MVTMKGRITKLFKQKNDGVIIDEKGQSRYFQFDQVNGSEPEFKDVLKDVLVDFVPAEDSELGLIATKIVCLETLRGRLNKLTDKGFGFILDQHSERRWFHFSDVVNSDSPDSMLLDDRVLFTPDAGEKGGVAKNIFLLDIHPVQDNESDAEVSPPTDALATEPPLAAWDSAHPPAENIEPTSPVQLASERDDHPPLAAWDSAHPPAEKTKPVVPVKHASETEQDEHLPLAAWDSVHAPAEEIEPTNPVKQASETELNEHSPLAAWDSAHPPAENSEPVARNEDAKLAAEQSARPLFDAETATLQSESVQTPVQESLSEMVAAVEQPLEPVTAAVEQATMPQESASPASVEVQASEVAPQPIEPSVEKIAASEASELPHPVVQQSETTPLSKESDAFSTAETSPPTETQLEEEPDEEYLSKSGWSTLEIEEDDEPAQAEQSSKTQTEHKSEQKKPSKRMQNQQHAEAKKQADIRKNRPDSKHYYRDKDNLKLVKPVTLDCKFREKYGLVLENCHHVTIENVQIARSEYECLKIKNCHDVTIKNCIFEGSQKGHGIELSNSFNIKLENVTCQNNSNTGMDVLQGSRDISILSSTFSNNTKAALRITNSHNVTLSNGTFNESTKGPGLHLDKVFAIQLENVNCGKNATFGIEIEKGSYDISILSSKLLENTEAAIRMTDGRNLNGRWLRLNKTAKGSGLLLREVQQLKFEDCHFDSNHSSGIALNSCTEATFSNSTFSENAKDGVYLKESERVYFEHCEFSDNHQSGLSTLKSGIVSVENSKLHFNKMHYGHFVEKSAVVITDCELRGKGQFVLKERSVLETNLKEHSTLTSLFKGAIFQVDSGSEVEIK